MKKTVIALAVATALPVAAQADFSLSGSASAEYTLGSNLVPEMETAVSISSTEVLANGMIATATMSVLSLEDTEGVVTLSGDFGSLSGGTAAAEAEAEDDDETLESINGIAYTGSFSGLSVNAAAGEWDHDSDSDDDFTDPNHPTDLQEYVKYGASYDFNGLLVAGTSTNKNAADNDDAESEITVSYNFGDLTLSGSKATGDSAVAKAAYTATVGDLAVMASADSANEWDLSVVYTIGDLAVTALDDEEDGGAEISAKYTAGGLSLEVDSENKIVVAYDMGNADLSMTREDESTKVKYTVAF